MVLPWNRVREKVEKGAVESQEASALPNASELHLAGWTRNVSYFIPPFGLLCSKFESSYFSLL